MKYDPLYAAFLVYFNRDRDYFECHEVLEELWLKRDKDPRYKGLLQVAVGLYHFRNGNVRGGRKMMVSALAKLDHLQEHALGICMGKLADEVRQYAERLKRYGEEPFSYYDLTISIADPVLLQVVEEAAAGIRPNIPQQRGPRRPSKRLRGQEARK